MNRSLSRKKLPSNATVRIDRVKQSQRTPGQSSPWELEPPSFTYCSYPPEALYPGHPGMDMHGPSSSTDQLHFQTQLLERLHNISPYQPQRSPYATPSPYAMPAPSFLLSPSSNKPSVSSFTLIKKIRLNQLKIRLESFK